MHKIHKINVKYSPVPITQYFDDILLCILLYFLYPVPDALETLPICHIINDHYPVRPFVVAAGNCFETVLARRVPLG